MLDFDTLNINLGLERTEKVLAAMGNPQNKFRSIHVAGTNGKGSVCAMLASILKEAGFKAGLFTSPHLYKWNERIKINGDDISDEELKIKNLQIKNWGEKLGVELTPFEIVTCVAFAYFAEQKVDYAVVETGMGGRLDATNVILPEISVITNVDLDHTEYLGKTIKAIASEKTGIIKHGVPLVTAEDKEEALAVIRHNCEEKDAGCWVLGMDASMDAGHGMPGLYQRKNEAVAIKVAEMLGIKKNVIIKGLQNTKWPARFQIVSKDPLTIIDGAHNPAGARALKESVEALKLNKPVTLILGFQEYKDIAGIVEVLSPIAKDMIYTASSHPQAAKLDNAKTPAEAIAAAKKIGNPIIIAGSLFVAAEALKLFGLTA